METKKMYKKFAKSCKTCANKEFCLKKESTLNGEFCTSYNVGGADIIKWCKNEI
jgi:hypothetical protein